MEATVRTSRNTYSLVLMRHFFLAPFHATGRTPTLLLILGNKLLFLEWVIALNLQISLERKPLFKIDMWNATLVFQKLTNAWTLSWWRCWKVARSTCPSSMGLRLINSGWIFSSRALTSHSCLCFTLRYGFASRASKFGSPAPGNKSTK